MDLLLVDRWAKHPFAEWTSFQAKIAGLADSCNLYPHILCFCFSFEVKHPIFFKIFFTSFPTSKIFGRVRNHSIFGCHLKRRLPTENTSIVGLPLINVNETGNVTVNVTVNQTDTMIGSRGWGCSVPGKMCCFFTISTWGNCTLKSLEYSKGALKC